MCGLEDVTSPDVGVVIFIQIYALVLRALDANVFNIADIKTRTYPSSEVFVGGMFKFKIKVVVVKGSDYPKESFAKFFDLSTRETGPICGQRATDLRQKTMAVKASRSMSLRQ
jgi:hypothetical protein